MDAAITGRMALKSGVVREGRQNIGEKGGEAIEAVGDYLPIPVVDKIVKGTGAVIGSGSSLASSRTRQHNVNKITVFFPNQATAGKIIRDVAYNLARDQEAEIVERAEQKLSLAKRIGNIATVNDVDNPIRKLAVEQAGNIMDNLDNIDSPRPLTLSDVSELVSIAKMGMAACAVVLAEDSKQYFEHWMSTIQCSLLLKR